MFEGIELLEMSLGGSSRALRTEWLIFNYFLCPMLFAFQSGSWRMNL